MSLEKEKVGADFAEHGVRSNTYINTKGSRVFGTNKKQDTNCCCNCIQRVGVEDENITDTVRTPFTIPLPPSSSTNNKDNNMEHAILSPITNTDVSINLSASKGINNYGFTFGKSPSSGNPTRRANGDVHAVASTQSSEPMKTLKNRKSSQHVPVVYKTNTFSVSETQTVHSSDYKFVNNTNHLQPRNLVSSTEKYRRSNSIS